MVTSRHITKNVGGSRRPGVIECGLALSVIVGLGFVSLRIMSMGLPATLGQSTVATAVPIDDTPSTATRVLAEQTH